MHNLSISPMNKKDIDVLKVFFVQAFRDELGEPWTEETSERHLLEAFNKDHCFSIKRAGQVIGGIFAYPLVLEKGTEIFIDVFVVSSEERGSGAGKMLFDHIIAHAKEKNFVGVRLLSNPKLRSYDWYHKMGLNESGWVELVKFFKQ
jgi:N-acetylglutamate synthase-like GNAT family acetyltransferase